MNNPDKKKITPNLASKDEEIIFAIFSVVPPQLKYITRIFEFFEFCAIRPHNVSIIIAVVIRIDLNFILCPPYD